MGQRLELQAILEAIVPNVYFQPPSNVVMQRPCILYKIDSQNTRFADDLPYHRRKRYMVTVIDSDPDSEIPDKVADLPMCTFDRFYTADQLNHNVFRLYF